MSDGVHVGALAAALATAFMLAIGRALASDSRHWGPIRQEWVSGTVGESP